MDSLVICVVLNKSLCIVLSTSKCAVDDHILMSKAVVLILVVKEPPFLNGSQPICSP